MQLLACIDDYTDFGILSENIMSEKLTMGHAFLHKFGLESSYETFTKYFNLIINIYISGEFNLGFTDSNKFNDFKKKVTRLAYKTLTDNKLIKKTHTSEMRFNSICLTLTALTNLRYHMPSIFPPYAPTTINPKAYYTLSELSTEISPKRYRLLLSDQLQGGAPSHQLYNIIDTLNIGIRRNMDGCSIAKHTVEKYLTEKKWTPSELGKIIHPIYERLLIEYLESKGVRVSHESFVHRIRNWVVDNIIERKSIKERMSGTKSKFETNIEALQNILTIPDSINLIAVDYTYTSNLKFILEKFDKNYQSEDRLLVIVLLGQKNDRDINKINKLLQQAVKNDDGSKHLENIRIITSEQYKEFLGFDGNFEKQFNRYQKLSFNLFHSTNLLFEAIRQNKHAVSWLEGHNEDWINIYLPQR